ncbi:MAG: ABC transporter permease [Clostridia bacterium]|nr:ABC transporter permease [Clostridia bacterium]
MSIWQAFKMAVKSVWSNKTRSALTMLGVIIGVSAVIAAVGFAQSCMKAVSGLIEGLGSNVVTAVITDYSSRNSIKVSDLDKFAESSPYIESISPFVMKNDMVRGNGENKYTSILGANEKYLAMDNIEIEFGRNISSTDIQNSSKVAVLCSAVTKKLFPDGDAIGKTIKINGVSFEVIGTTKSTMNDADGTDDDQVIIPVNVAQRTLKISSVTMFMASAASSETIDLATQAIEKYLYSIFKDDDSFMIITQESMLSMLDQITNIMMLIIGGVATISLVVGGIGIMNIMFVSVSERTREIGIRKAIGAKKSDIMKQFLIEALLLTVVGGIIGIVLGVLIIKYVVGAIDALTPVYSKEWIIAAFTISAAIGIGFGVFPANKAASLNPIDALRNE